LHIVSINFIAIIAILALGSIIIPWDLVEFISSKLSVRSEEFCAEHCCPGFDTTSRLFSLSRNAKGL